MEININTNNTIDRHQGLDERVRTSVEDAISRFSEQVRRVDVHLSDENSQKHEDGANYCMLEARVSGYAPVVVHAHAANLDQSITVACGKLKRALDSALGRLNDKKLRETPPVGAIVADADELDATADKNLTSN
jgi:ribosome-associated translation inhibitor RaiA